MEVFGRVLILRIFDDIFIDDKNKLFIGRISHCRGKPKARKVDLQYLVQFRKGAGSNMGFSLNQ